jgi:hypothetical protein
VLAVLGWALCSSCAVRKQSTANGWCLLCMGGRGVRACDAPSGLELKIDLIDL